MNVVASKSCIFSVTHRGAGVGHLVDGSIGSVGSGETGQWRRNAQCALRSIGGYGLQTALLWFIDAATDQGIKVDGKVGVAEAVEITFCVQDIAGTAY
jgi:hypothetical protein